MSSSRNLRWVLLVVVGLAVLVVGAGVFWLRQPVRPEPAPLTSPQKEVEKPVANEVKIVGQVRKLELGKPIEDHLKGGERHAYELHLKAGEYAYVVAEQKGIDVAVRLIGPDGQQIIRVDSPNGNKGPEPVHEIAGAESTYRVEVIREEGAAAAGPYEIELKILRPAEAADRKRVEAEKLFLAGEDLRREGGTEAYHQALVNYREALPVWKELGDESREADTLFQIGWVSREANDSPNALTAFQEALPLYQKLGNQARVGVVFNFLSSVQYQLGDFDRSLDLAQQALTTFRDQREKDQALEASALNNLASAQSALGRYQKALDAYREALTAARQARRSDEEAIALFGIGDVQTNQGQLEEALDSLQQTLEIYRTAQNAGDAANTRRRIANVQQRLGHLDDALTNLEKALKVQESLGDRLGEAVTLNSIGTIQLSRNPEAAGQAYRKALDLARQARDPLNEAISLLNLGRYSFAIHDLGQAVKKHDEATQLFQSLRNLPGEASSTFGSARALHALGDFKAAEERLQKVMEHVEALRSGTESADLRTSYFATKQHYYDLHIDVLMHLDEQEPGTGYSTKAFDINERRRARGLLDLLAEAKAGILKGDDPALVTRESEIQQRLDGLDGQLADAQSKFDALQASAIEKKQRELLTELESVRTEIRRRNPRFAALTRPEPLGLEEVRKKLLDAKTLMLVYSLGDERGFLWSVPKKGAVKVYPLPGRSSIEDVARQALKGWSQRGRPGPREEHWGQKLSEMLLGKVKDDLGTRRLLIIADGALQSIPFAALPDPRAEGASAPLLLNNEIISLPSASVLRSLREDFFDRDLAPLRIAVIADPVFGPDDPRLAENGIKPQTTADGETDRDLNRAVRDFGLDRLNRLPHTEEEARAIGELVVPEQRLEALGFEASREVAKSPNLRKYRVLHFATHGLLNTKHPELSGLVFSQFDAQGNRRDGFLRSYEIYNLDLRAELVVLSACQTGLGEDVRGEGIVGLTRSFMYAGVPRVVVSLWNVSDHATAELMKRFYKALIKKRLAPSAALRCAQLSLMQHKEWSDPYYWAPFIFQGEWNLDTASPDGGIEVQPGGSKLPVTSDIDLPPPTFGPPVGCPDLD